MVFEVLEQYISPMNKIFSSVVLSKGNPALDPRANYFMARNTFYFISPWAHKPADLALINFTLD